MKKVLLLVIGVIFLYVNAAALLPADTSRFLKNTQTEGVYSLRTFNILNEWVGEIDREFTTTWNERLAVPTSISGNIDKSQNVVSNLYNYLPEGMDLKVVKNNIHKIYEYSKDGVKVFPGTITYKENKRTFMLAGSLIFDGKVLNNDNISSRDAEEAAREYIGTSREGKVIDNEKIYFNTLSGLKHAYAVKLYSENPGGDFYIVVDAQNEEVLFCDDYRQYYEGYASVYETNPLKANVTKTKIFNIKNNGKLYGNYANAVNDDYDEATSSNNYFVYDKDDTHFDEANVYYHGDRIHDFYKSNFGYNGLDKSMKATVHYGDNYDNAFFSPWGGYFCYGDGNKLNILSREASVIYHEYTHAVSYDIAGLGNYGEAGGMNEGFSDYFGNSLTDDPEIGEWTMAKLGKPYMRSCINDSHYPEDYQGECHADSLMWSAPLWEMRTQFGRKVGDRLAHSARYYINRNSTFADGLQAILNTDEEFFGGSHKDQIIKIFAKRGITLNDSSFRQMMNEKAMLQEIYGY